MALNTGKKIDRRSWDVIPMPDLVIARVNELAGDQPEQMIFTDRHGRLIGEIEIPGVDSIQNDHVEFPGVDPVNDEEFPGVEPVIDENVEIPGVDDEAVHGNDAPQIVEINDPDIPALDPDPAHIEAERT